jgi:protease PrsW
MDENRSHGMLKNGLLVFFALVSLGAFLTSLTILYVLPAVLGQGLDVAHIEALATDAQFGLSGPAGSFLPSDSPYELSYSLATPPLSEGDSVMLYLMSGKMVRQEIDCLGQYNRSDEYSGLTEINCTIPVEYAYSQSEDGAVYAVYSQGGRDLYHSGPNKISLGWSDYEGGLTVAFGALLFISIIGLVACALIFCMMLYISFMTRHVEGYPGEYALSNLFSLDAIRRYPTSIIATPVFWVLQLGLILVLIASIFISTDAGKSANAAIAFIISGLMAFIVPFLLVSLVWLIDFREREPIRMIATMFLWGGVAAVLAIGLNSSADLVFTVFSLGALTSFLVAPVVEEFFKGMGVSVLSFHHEFNGITDGIVYGFTVGMGFAFIENWLYFMKFGIGADIGGWAALYFFRSILLVANHGVFTAFTGLVIGYLKQKGKWYAPFGMLAGIIIAAFLHGMHNSGELLGQLCGPAGLLAYALFVIPVFDYGGLAVILAILIISAVVWDRKLKK